MASYVTAPPAVNTKIKNGRAKQAGDTAARVDGAAVPGSAQRTGARNGRQPACPSPRVRGAGPEAAADGSAVVDLPVGGPPAGGERGGAGGGAAGLDKSQSYETQPELTPEQAWRQEHRWELLRGLRKLSSKVRVRKCKTPLGATDVGVAVRDGRAHLQGLESCGNVWACPVCTAKIRYGRMEDVMLALDIHTNLNGGGLVFGTFTLPHTAGDRLGRLVELLGEAMTYLSRQRGFKEWRERVGLVGNITALEVTHGENGWHPHRHVMYLTDRQLSEDEVAAWESVLHALYNRLLAKNGWKASKDHVGVRLDYVADPKDAAAIGQYVTKLQAGFELTRSDLKKSRAADKKGAMPFDLLERAIAGDSTAKRLWHEYEQAMTGKSSVRFSKGLRDKLGMVAAKTDQELAEEEVGGELLCRLTGKLYRRVFHDGQVVMTLRQAEREGVAGVLRGLRRLYGDQIEAQEDHAGLRVSIKRRC